MEKICSTCKLLKQHHLRRGDKPNSRCIDCQRIYTNKHYAANKEKRKQQIRESESLRWASNKKKVDEHKSVHGCFDCGEKDPIVLDFDHLSDKTNSVSIMIKSCSWSKVWEEIQKCEVVCANCHRRRTHSRRQDLRNHW